MTTRRTDSNRTQESMTRRDVLGAAATVAACTIVPRHVLGGAGNTAPSEKVNVAIIGTGGQGIVNMKQLFNEPGARVVSLCDINDESDYSMFYYGDTAGLKPAIELARKVRKRETGLNWPAERIAQVKACLPEEPEPADKG